MAAISMETNRGKILFVCFFSIFFMLIIINVLKSQVGLLQTAHSWANAGVLLGGRMRRRIAFATIKLSG